MADLFIVAIDNQNCSVGLEVFGHQSFDRCVNAKQRILAVARAPSPNPGPRCIWRSVNRNLPLKRWVPPLAERRIENRHSIGVGHQDNRLKLWLSSLPREQMAVSVDVLVLDRLGKQL